MLVQVNASEVSGSEALASYVQEAIEKAVKHLQHRITRVEVHLTKNDGPIDGGDQRCLIEARPAGKKPIAVHSTDHDIYDAIKKAAGKLERHMAKELRKND